MYKRTWLIILLLVLSLAIGVAAVQAQTNGAIRGTIYQDTNSDGVCGAGDPIIASVPVEFAPDGGQTITLVSGIDGTYGLVAATLGTWRVTAVAPSGYTTTSEPTIVVVLNEENPVAEGINFCLAQSGATPTPPTTLPESGAAVPPTLLAAAILGAVLLFAGIGLIVRDRRAVE